MRKLYFLLLVAVAIASAWAQNSQSAWQVTLHVIDEAGQPVNGASATVSYYVHPPAGQSEASEKIQGITDGNGIFTASHSDTGSIGLSFQVKKAGYYSTTKGHEFVKFKDADPAKWHPYETLILKKIADPIPMYAKFTINLKVPALDTPIGFDLTIGDWVAPYGKGSSTDLIFQKEYSRRAANDYASQITVAFPNKGDGIQVFTASDEEKGSELRSPHEAPLDGYETSLSRLISARTGQPRKFEYDENRIYLFRVRTVLDADGTAKTCLYGKIYGDFMQMRYYLNPTPNDRNIEFDPKQNLLKGLNPLDEVSAP